MSSGDRVIQIKKHFGLNNAELGRHAKVSRSAVGLWINNDATPGWCAAENLRKSLGINPSWVIGGHGSMMSAPLPNDPFFVALGEIALNLDESDKEALLATARAFAAKNMKQS